MKLEVNTKGLDQLGNTLQKINKAAFPSAVRNTLNDAAFEMKKNQIIKSAKKNFKGLKSQTFFKKNTGVDKASGFAVNKMRATIGFLNAGDASVRRAIEGLEKQEIGGVIDDGLRYLKYSRGNRIRGFVQKKNYYDPQKVVSGRNRKRGGTLKSKFVARVFRARKENKPMFFNTMKGNFLVTVKSLSSDMKSKKLDIKFNFVMMSRRVKASKIKSTHFNEEAAEATKKMLPELYRKNAEYQFKKYTKK